MTALAASADTTAGRAPMRAVLHAALDAVVAIDGAGRVVEWNAAAERIFGYRAEAALGREIAELIVPPELRDRHRAGLARHVAGGPPVLLGPAHRDHRPARAAASEFPAELTITRWWCRGEPLFVAYVRDIGDRLRAEAELRASRARIVAAADAARRAHRARPPRRRAAAPRGARARRCGSRGTRRGRDPRGAAELLDGALDELAAATAELRELARGIHPVVLTEGGLEPALAGLAAPLRPAGRDRRAAARSACRAEVEATAYYVVAEALTNVARHAGADGAAVAVARADGALVVGCATTAAAARARRRLGPAGLADRVAALGGALVVASPPGGGTTVRAEIPCAS